MELRCAVAVLLSASLCGVRAMLWPQQLALEEQLADQIAATLQKIFTNGLAAHNCSVFISSAYEEMDADRVILVQRVLHRSLYQPNAPVPVVLATEMNRKITAHVFTQLLFVQSAEQAIAIAEGVNRNRMCLIVLLTSQPKRPIMARIFTYFMQERYNINVVILVPGVQRVQAFNVRPYTPTSCTSVEPVEIDINEGDLWDVFPSRLKNLHGCPLSAVVWDIPPYMRIDWKSSDPMDGLDGLDGKLLRIVARKMNFTLRLIPNEPEGLIGGFSFMNGTFTGAYKMLRERRANITIGCAACTPERSTFLEATSPYSQMAYIIVMRARGGYSIYEVMLFPFEKYTWLLLSTVLGLHWIVGSRWRMPSPILAGWMLWIFVIRASYEASVFNFIHNSPVKPSPRTLEQALNGGFRFITDHATYRMTLQIPSFQGKTSISAGQPVDVFDALMKAPWKTGAFTSRAFLADHLVRHRKHRNRLVILAEKIIDNMLCVYFPYGSYFAWEINNLLFKMRSFGIFQHHSQILAWNSMPTTTDTDSPGQTIHSSTESAVTGFAESMSFVLAALNCLMGALCVSIVVFGLELLSQRRRWTGLAWLFERV
ncbi:uncharacterized protein LOC6551502 [Drosophila erecta]|uniref:Putative ionotropic receptor ligand binding domain-containing protein n=1 Tax=Drosophila erecta TaxID=7220 RepID=B3NTT7_DROER|nr:uncharacterized protein LOC6551502 [Drosophila erecta]EDV47500.1 uncharacterized protein Dere_GG17607 [Drosophila erecta]